MSNLAIITARGGSKRIPHKNIKTFCGKPILAYSIEAAAASGIFNEVMVSTDSKEIAETAEQYGARVPFMRSEKTSGDFATTADVLDEVLFCYREMGNSFDYFCCLYPTAPFVTAERLREAFDKLKTEDADELITVVKYDFPPQRAFVVRNGLLQYQYPEYSLKRSQDLEPIYHDCGQFYFYKTSAFLDRTSVLCPRTVPFIMSSLETQDIDTPEDWQIAEEKMSALRLQREHLQNQDKD